MGFLPSTRIHHQGHIDLKTSNERTHPTWIIEVWILERFLPRFEALIVEVVDSLIRITLRSRVPVTRVIGPMRIVVFKPQRESAHNDEGVVITVTVRIDFDRFVLCAKSGSTSEEGEKGRDNGIVAFHV